jgi:hypothetical protein
MDENIHGAAARRQPAPVESGNDPSVAQDGLAEYNIVRICGWCPELNILKLERRYTDSVVIVFHGGRSWPECLQIFRNGEELQISHGICERCGRLVHENRFHGGAKSL